MLRQHGITQSLSDRADYLRHRRRSSFEACLTCSLRASCSTRVEQLLHRQPRLLFQKLFTQSCRTWVLYSWLMKRYVFPTYRMDARAVLINPEFNCVISPVQPYGGPCIWSSQELRRHDSFIVEC